MRKSHKSSPSSHGGRDRNTCRNWMDLPDDIAASILSRLGTLEILTTAQLVCTTWRRICKENPLVWQAINISEECDKYCHVNIGYLDKICRHVIDLSSGNLVDINVEYIGSDQLLKYMAESSRRIRRLRFVNCSRLTDEGLSEVASKLPMLEDLHISKCQHVSFKSFQLATCSFPLLKSCKLGSLKLDLIKCNQVPLYVGSIINISV